MSNEIKNVKTLTINGTKYKFRGSIEQLSCGEISISADSSGTADMAALFSCNNPYLSVTVDAHLPYKYGAVTSPTETAIIFSESSTYAVGDIATYSNVVYRCTTAVTTAGAWSSANWTAATAYSSTATYAVGAFVTYNDAYYVCSTAITTAEEWNEDHWTAAFVNEITVALDDGKLTRIPLGTNVGRVNLSLAEPANGQLFEAIVRVTIGSCVPSFTYSVPGKVLNLLEASGDDLEAGSAFEKLLTLYPSDVSGKDYDVTISTRKIGE